MSKKFLLLAFSLEFIFLSHHEIYGRTVIVDEGAYISDEEGSSLLLDLKKNPQYSFDHFSKKGFEVYGPRGLFEDLHSRKIPFHNLNLESFSRARISDYPSYEEIVQRLQNIQMNHPQISQLYSIGKSVQGRDLWVLKISKNPLVDEHKPEFKYISSMHGNEITGRELMLNLAEDLLNAYGTDSELTKIIDETEIFIMPSMNPDGSERGSRGNADGIDLNRDFPDFSTVDHDNSMEGRAIETQAVMKFQAERNFALSANFHGGAEVVNYPWDTIQDIFPFDSLIKAFSLEYSALVDYIHHSNEFSEGITNGYAWYEVDGGMQDWSYNWYGDLQITIELSNQKWPPFSQIPYYYSMNKNALIHYLELIHQGAGFFTSDPLESGNVAIVQIKEDGSQKVLGIFPYRHGEFYKVLEEGNYIFAITPDNSTTPFPQIISPKVERKHFSNLVHLPTFAND